MNEYMQIVRTVHMHTHVHTHKCMQTQTNINPLTAKRIYTYIMQKSKLGF